ncbi:MAG TPA: STAS domain-containing protein [Immundisolibacter sp.]|jgi:anti-anti-sigma factor
MKMAVVERDDEVVQISLIGRMDALGVEDIAIPFTAATATRNALVAIDLAQLDFLASVGLRLFFANARTLQQRGGKMALAGARPDVQAVLDATGVGQIISMYPTVDAACAALQNGA